MLSILAAATLSLAPLQDVTLKVGDPAPPIHVAEWVKGDPVPAFEKGKVYVVEFWATWCGPCIVQMPHLSEMQAKYRDRGLTVIGMSSVDSRGNTLEKVKKMVADKGDVMGYTVAWDVERKTNEAYMRAAGRNGIPCSFLIDGEGKLAYVGHPMWLEMPLAGVVDGTWNAERDTPKVAKAQEEFYALMRIEDPAEAARKMDAYAAEYPLFASYLDEARLNNFIAAGDYTKAYALMGKLVDKAIEQKNAGKLNSFAWLIVDPEATHAERDLDLALRAAQAANELTKGENASILDTLARAHFLLGHRQQAIDLQRKAIEVAPDGQKDALRGALEEYESAA